MHLRAMLLYVVLAMLALLTPEWMTPPGRPVVFSIPGMVGLLTLWSLGLAVWVATVMRRPLSPEQEKSVAYPVALAAIGAVMVRAVFSQDIYLYVAQGRQLGIYGVSPYKEPLTTLIKDPILAQIDPFWFGQTSLFGCLSLLCFALGNLIGPNGSVFGLARTIKVIWLVPYALLAAQLWRRWEGHPHRVALCLAFVANPSLIFLLLTEGHVDVFFLLFMVMSGIALEKRDAVASALLLCATTCFKMTAVVVVPVFACYLWRKERSKAVTFAGLYLLCYGCIVAALGGGEWFGVLAQVKSFSGLSFGAAFPQLLLLLGLQDVAVIMKLSDALFYLSVAAICLATLTGRTPENPFLGVGLTIAALYFTRAYVQPWYLLWFWPLLWLSTQRTRVVLGSMAVGTFAILFSNLYLVSWTPWVVAAAFAFDLLWIHRRDGSASRPGHLGRCGCSLSRRGLRGEV